MKRNFSPRAEARPDPSVDLPLSVTKMVEYCPNTPLTPAQKTRLQNRLNQLLCQDKTPDHPPYSAMIEMAIVKLDEKGGSSQESISKFLEKEYKDLSGAHLTILKHHLEKLCESGAIILTRCKRYVIAGANNASQKATTAKSETTSVKRIWKWDLDRQQKRLKKQLVQKKNILKITRKSETKSPVKRIFKWDWERQQRRQKKQLVQKMKCDSIKIEVTEKQLVPNNIQEIGLVEEEQAKESSQALVVMAEPKTRAYQKRLKGHGLVSEKLRRSKRLAETRPEIIKLCPELKRPGQDQEIEQESSQITELQQDKESENQISENVVIKKFDGLVKTYRRRRKAEFDHERVIVEDTQKEVLKSEISSLCLDIINEDQNLERVKDASCTWISGKRLRPRQRKSDATVFCSELGLRTEEALKTTDSVSNGREKLPDERPKMIRRRVGRPAKRRLLAALLKDKLCR